MKLNKNVEKYLFLLYLAEQELLDKYVNNIISKTSNPYQTEFDVYDDFSLISSFVWNASPEGYGFWKKVEDDYEKFKWTLSNLC